MEVKIDNGQKKVESMLFYFFWGALMTGNALGYGLGNAVSRHICYFSVVFVFLKFLISDYKKKEVLICAALIALGCLIWYFSGKVTPLFTMIAITSMKNVSHDKVTKFTFWLTGIIYVIKTTLSILGVIDIGKIVLSTGRIRYRLNYEHSNVAHGILFLIIVSCILAYHRSLKLYHYLILEIYNCFIYRYTDSRTGFIIATVCIALSCAAGFTYVEPKLYEILKAVSGRAFTMITLLSILATLLCSILLHFSLLDSEINYTNKFVTFYLRYRNAGEIIKNNSLSLFGVPEVVIVDGMVSVIYGYGIIFTLLFLAGYYFLFRQYRDKNDIFLMIVCCCYALYCITESFSVSIFMNITLLALSELIFNSSAETRNNS